MTGTSDNEFDPYGLLQRDQAAKIVLETSKLFDSNVDYCHGADPFPDVTPGDWSYQYVCRAKSLGIVKGYETGPDAGLFRPDKAVNWAEYLTMLLRQVDLSEPIRSQAYNGGAYYDKYLNYALQYNLVDFSTLVPEMNAIRIDVADSIYRLDKAGKL